MKIHRTFGRNLSSLRIDNKKRITYENPKKRIDKNTVYDKDDRKVLGNESLIVANKDKEKSNLDLDALDYSEIGETTTPKSEGFNETQNNLVNLTRSDKNDNNDVRDSTADSGLENENSCTFIRHFLSEVSGALIAIRTFL